MKKCILACMLGLGSMCATTYSVAAEETSYAAQEVCVVNNSRGSHDIYDSAIAILFSGPATVTCLVPKNVHLGMSHAYVRIKPGYSRSGIDRNYCRVDSVHPYGTKYTRPYYGGLYYSNGYTNHQSIIVRPPNSLHKWGHLTISCGVKAGDTLYGVHIVQQ